ncbi:TadA family conjugal transfer-associated ATPase [Lysinimonas soli]|uniref:TadA family conjugal transfer-associated ATPase n=1 Tax=Lysinimonas soli TaxID=1074233 RepID=A0ABW0NTW0_9MICO
MTTSKFAPAFAAGIPADGEARLGAAGPGARARHTGVQRGGPEFGVLAPLVSDPQASDVFVNPDGTVWHDRGGGVATQAGIRIPADEARDLAVRLVALGGRHVDEATPCVDVRLGAGVRVHVVLAPVASGGPAISIRLQQLEPIGIDRLIADSFFSAVAVDDVLELVRRRANLLITGAGGSGKTTLLGALLSRAAPEERIVVLEDVAELRIAHPHVVALEARQANLDGAGAIGLDRLVREALRMRPDRLVIGECRGAEVRELLAALNTGHDGGAGTLHANSLADVPARLEALAALAALSIDAMARQAVSAFDAVLHIERSANGRRLAAVGRLELDRRGRLAVTT